MTIKNDKIYSANIQFEHVDIENESWPVSVNGDISLISAEEIVDNDDEEVVYCFWFDGAYYALLKTDVSIPWNSSYKLKTLNVNFDSVNEIIIDELVADEVNGIGIDVEGNVWISAPDMLISINANMETYEFFYVDIDVEYKAMSVCGNDIYLVLQNVDGYIELMNIKSEDLSVNYQHIIPVSYSVYDIYGFGFAQGFESPHFLINSVLYQFDSEQYELCELLNMTTYNVNINENYIVYSDETFYFIGSVDMISEFKSGLAKLRLMEIAPENQLHIAVINTRSDEDETQYKLMTSLAAEYNLRSSQYFIDVNLYNLSELNDVITSSGLGNGDDIVCVSSDYLYPFLSSNSLIDINSRINGDIASCVMDNVLNSECSDGECYFVSPFIKLYCLEKFEEDYDSYNHVMRHDTKENLMSLFYPELIDMNQYEVSSEKLLGILDFIDENSSTEYEETSAISIQLEQGELYCLNEDIQSFPLFLIMVYRLGFIPDIEPLPGFSQPLFKSDYCLGILNSCENTHAAMEFLEFTLSYNLQYTYSLKPDYGFLVPVNGEAFHDSINYFESLYKAGNINSRGVLIDGNYYRDINWYLLSDYEEAEYLSSVNSMVNQLKDSHQNLLTHNNVDEYLPFMYEIPDIEIVAAEYTNIFESTSRFYLPDMDKLNIINEEIQPYFSGDKTQVETIDVILGRFSSF